MTLPSEHKPGLMCLDHYNWFGLNFEAVAEIAASLGYAYHRFDVSRPSKEAAAGGAGSCYRDINVDAAICYTVCNELELTPSQVDPQNEKHRAVVDKWRSLARLRIDYTLHAIREKGIARFLIPQGYVLEAAICRLIANKLGLPLLSIENTMVKDRLLWDNVSGITVNSNLAKNYFWKYKDSLDPTESEMFAQNYIGKVKSLKSDEHASPGKGPEIPSDKKIIVCLGQVYVDSSVLFGLYDGFKDQVDVMEQLAEFAVRNDCALIVKLHPKETVGNSIIDRPLNRLTWRKLSQSAVFMDLYNRHQDVIVDYDNLYDTYELIKKAAVCVTVNSMAGLESCLLNRPTITCGYSSYGCLGFTAEATHKRLLHYYLDRLLIGEEGFGASDACKLFFFTYLKLYCIEKSESALAEKCLMNYA